MLRAERVYLAPLAIDDLPILYRWINDRDQVLFNNPYKPVTEAQHRAWYENLQKHDDVVIFGIRLLETGALIGTCQLRKIDRLNRNAELQIRIGEAPQQGRGYGTEAVRLLLEFAYRDLNLHRVQLRVFATNARAIRAYEKAGFVMEGCHRDAVHIDGRYLDIVSMGHLRADARPTVSPPADATWVPAERPFAR